MNMMSPGNAGLITTILIATLCDVGTNMEFSGLKPCYVHSQGLPPDDLSAEIRPNGGESPKKHLLPQEESLFKSFKCIEQHYGNPKGVLHFNNELIHPKTEMHSNGNNAEDSTLSPGDLADFVKANHTDSNVQRSAYFRKLIFRPMNNSIGKKSNDFKTIGKLGYRPEKNLLFRFFIEETKYREPRGDWKKSYRRSKSLGSQKLKHEYDNFKQNTSASHYEFPPTDDDLIQNSANNSITYANSGDNKQNSSLNNEVNNVTLSKDLLEHSDVKVEYLLQYPKKYLEETISTPIATVKRNEKEFIGNNFTNSFKNARYDSSVGFVEKWPYNISRSLNSVTTTFTYEPDTKNSNFNTSRKNYGSRNTIGSNDFSSSEVVTSVSDVKKMANSKAKDFSLPIYESQSLHISLNEEDNEQEFKNPELSTKPQPFASMRRHKLLQDEKTDTHDYLDYDYEDSVTKDTSTPSFSSMPEFQPGHLELSHRKPIMEQSGFQFEDTTGKRDDGIPIWSKDFPFRIEDATLRLANKDLKIVSSTKREVKSNISTMKTEGHDFPNISEDDSDYVDIRETSLTMETLAYFLIGTCCGLSILCLCIVVAAIKCRRSLVERRIRKQFRSKLYYPKKRHKAAAYAWQQQLFDHIMYTQGTKHPDSSFSSRDTCHCRCVTWSLGARNLDTQPICPTQNSAYLCGRKKLPFGAASTLQYESMIGRHCLTPSRQPMPESSNENDSLDDSVADPAETSYPEKCTCIRSSWKNMSREHTSLNVYPLQRMAGPQIFLGKPAEVTKLKCSYQNCSPVIGRNYMDRSDATVYWSSNDERLI